MRTKLKSIIVVGIASFLLVGCSTPHRASREWEYKAVRLNPTTQNFEASLNAASKGGWQLLTVVTLEREGPGYGQYIFHRQRP
jgi:hypothetical protein